MKLKVKEVSQIIQENKSLKKGRRKLVEGATHIHNLLPPQEIKHWSRDSTSNRIIDSQKGRQQESEKILPLNS